MVGGHLIVRTGVAARGVPRHHGDRVAHRRRRRSPRTRSRSSSGTSSPSRSTRSRSPAQAIVGRAPRRGRSAGRTTRSRRMLEWGVVVGHRRSRCSSSRREPILGVVFTRRPRGARPTAPRALGRRADAAARRDRLRARRHPHRRRRLPVPRVAMVGRHRGVLPVRAARSLVTGAGLLALWGALSSSCSPASSGWVAGTAATAGSSPARVAYIALRSMRRSGPASASRRDARSRPDRGPSRGAPPPALRTAWPTSDAGTDVDLTRSTHALGRAARPGPEPCPPTQRRRRASAAPTSTSGAAASTCARWPAGSTTRSTALVPGRVGGPREDPRRRRRAARRQPRRARSRPTRRRSCTASRRELGRPVYGLAEHLFRALPVVGTLWSRGGGVAAHPDNAYRLLHEQEQLVLVFPEGTKGTGKHLQRALPAAPLRPRRLRRDRDARRRARSCPIAVVGAEESMPIVFKSTPARRSCSASRTSRSPPTCSLFGPLGLVALLPGQVQLRVLAPVHFDVAARPGALLAQPGDGRVRAHPRSTIQDALYDMLRTRRSVWFG